ncbi:MAG: hypothetical protein IPK26_07175 [Planctomycetes bacterium]|nr:hypothetical protein [Planctomycetota bacterium]
MFSNRWAFVAAAILPCLLAGSAAAQNTTPPKAAPAARQQKSQEELIKLRDEKFALEVFKKAPWTFDYDAARAEAKQTGKPIFGYFSRSYAH